MGYRTLKSSADALVEYVVMRIKALQFDVRGKIYNLF